MTPSPLAPSTPRRRILLRWLAVLLAVAAVSVALPVREIAPFLIARHQCPQLRWSALFCPGLDARADVQLQPPMEGVRAEVFCPEAGSLDDLLSASGWADPYAPPGWAHPEPAATLPFLGSRTVQSPAAIMPAETALWGAPGLGYAVVLDAVAFGPACGASKAGWQDVPTPEWIRRIERVRRAGERAVP